MRYTEKYTDEELIADALLYKTKGEWNKNSAMYAIAYRRNLIAECTKHMVNGRYKLTTYQLIEDAQKYKSRSEWRANSTNYVTAHRRGVLDECTKHMEYQANAYNSDMGIIYMYVFSDNTAYIGLSVNPKKRFRSHTTEKGAVFDKIQRGFTYEYKILEDGISNKDLSDREIYYIAKYKSDTNFILLNTHKGGARGCLNRVTNKHIKESALKYDTIYDWYTNDRKSYDVANRRNILGEVSGHMTTKIKRWSNNELILDARKFQTRNEWRKTSNSAYRSAHSKKILHLCCAHMKVLQHLWTKAEIYNMAIKYQSKKEWRKGNIKSYDAAARHKILDECLDLIKKNII